MSVVGFDFGNDWCRVGVVRRGAVEVLQNEIGNRNTASMVAFSRNQRLLGDAAAPQFKSNYVNTIINAKRVIGQNFENIKGTELPLLPYKIIPGEYGPAVEVAYNGTKETISLQHITGALLGQLKKTAEKGLGQVVRDCVIGVPPYWNESQRLALLDAAQVAGLNARLMNETTAIALNYGMLRPLPKDTSLKVLFVDVGACSTNVALVSFQQGKLQVLNTASDASLGGRNFDQALVEHFAKHVNEKYKLPVLTNAKATMKLRDECMRIKKVLSANTKVKFHVEYIMNDKDVDGEIERGDFEKMCAPLLKRLTLPIDEVMKKSGAKKEEIYSVEIVGGATRIPMVKKFLSDYFGKEVSQTCDADESIARGCALLCALKSPTVKVKEFEVVDINYSDVLFAWGDIGKSEEQQVLFPAGHPLSSSRAITLKNRAKPIEITATQAPELKVGRWVVANIPNATPGAVNVKVKVTAKLDHNAIVGLTSAQWIETIEVPVEAEKKPAPSEAQPASGGESAKEEKKPGETKVEDKKEEKKTEKQKRTVDLQVTEEKPGRIDAAGIQKLREREVAMITQDALIIETNEARNAVESYVLDTRSKLDGELAAFVKPDVKDDFVRTLTDTEEWVYDNSDAPKAEYQSRLKALKVVGDPIERRYVEAQRRPELIQELTKAITDSKLWVESKEEKYAHIKPEERKKVLDLCNQTRDWLTKEVAKQEKAQPHEDPIITCDALQAKITQVQNHAKSVMSEPAPQPQPQPQPKDEKPKEEKSEKQPEAAKDEQQAEKKQKKAPAQDSKSQSKPESPQPMDTRE